MPWQPGQSGNPGGRPKTLQMFRQELQQKCGPKLIAVLERALDAEDTRIALEAAKFAAAYLYGKPSESVASAEPVTVPPIEDVRKALEEARAA